MPRTASRALSLLGLCALLAAGAGCSSNHVNGPAAQMSFGVAMAQRGLWSEALFRFREASKLDPSNPRIYNNLAVASEAAGNFDDALSYYKKALQLDPANRDLKANYARFAEFYQGFKGKAETEKTPQTEPAKGTEKKPPAAGAEPGG
jgi:Flp pilus assembly protein TadD